MRLLSPSLHPCMCSASPDFALLAGLEPATTSQPSGTREPGTAFVLPGTRGTQTAGGQPRDRPSGRVIPSRDSEWPEGPWAAASRGLSSLLPRNPIVSFVGSAEAMGQACFQLPEGLGKGRGTSPRSGCSCKPCCRAWLFLSPSSPRTGALQQLGPCPTLRAEAARMGEIGAALEE